MYMYDYFDLLFDTLSFDILQNVFIFSCMDFLKSQTMNHICNTGSLDQKVYIEAFLSL